MVIFSKNSVIFGFVADHGRPRTCIKYFESKLKPLSGAPHEQSESDGAFTFAQLAPTKFSNLIKLNENSKWFIDWYAYHYKYLTDSI